MEPSIDRGTRPVVLEWPVGAGRIVFSGAMDAWRFRAAPDDGFGRFWRSRIAEAAAAAPARLEASITPGVPRPGQDVTIRARIRPTELEYSTDGTRTPAVRARLVGADGRDELVRLWPTAELGVFEGRFEAPSPGTYNLQVSTSTGASADEVVTVGVDTRDGMNSDESERTLRLIAASTGGVAVEASDLTPLERHLRGLTKGEVERRFVRRGRWRRSYSLSGCSRRSGQFEGGGGGLTGRRSAFGDRRRRSGRSLSRDIPTTDQRAPTAERRPDRNAA